MGFINNFFDKSVEQLKKTSNIITSKEGYDNEIDAYNNYLKLARTLDVALKNEPVHKLELDKLEILYAQKNAKIDEIKKLIVNYKNFIIEEAYKNKKNDVYKILFLLNKIKADYSNYKSFNKISFIKNINDLEMNIMIINSAILLIRASENYDYQAEIYKKLK